MGAAPNKSADYFVTFLRSVLRPTNTYPGKPPGSCGRLPSNQGVGSLTGKWLLLDDVFVKLLSGGLDIAVVQDIIDKLANPFAMLFHGPRSLSLTLIAFCLNQCLALWQ
jgi:hypothetical protein